MYMMVELHTSCADIALKQAIYQKYIRKFQNLEFKANTLKVVT